MEQFITWYCSEPRLALNRAVVLRFRLHLEALGLAAGTINQRLAAVRRLAYEAADSGLLSPELAAGIRRVKRVKQLGSRSGNWLTRDQARMLLEKSDGESLRSIRDVAMISILLGCGLRRAELVSLRKRRPNSPGTLGNRGSRRKGWSRPYGSGSWLGKERRRQVDVSGRCHGGPSFQSRQPARNRMG